MYAPCEADFDGGRCVNLSLSFVSPPNGAVYDAGITLPVEVSARLRDGGAFAVSVPLSSNASAPATIAAGVPANVTLPVAGAWSFTAGWDGGPSASVSVQTLSCVATCQPWQLCAPSLDGGSCPSLNLSLTWTSPDAGLAFNSASVPARLSVTRSGGPVPPGLTSIPLSGPTGALAPLTGSAGTFTGTLPMAAPEGNKTFVAGWPGGPTASLTITRDTVPPEVVLLPLTRPASWPDPWSRDPDAWKKNETALVSVVVDGGPPVTVADLSVVDSGVTISQVAPTACGCSGCQCFEVPLARAAEFASPRGLLRFNVLLTVRSISDSAGNQSPAVSGELPVTRFLWQQPFGGTGLALAENGTLLVSSATELRAVDRDGGTMWTWSPIAGSLHSTRPPVVGAASVYVTVYDGSSESSILRLSLATGAVTQTTCTSAEGVDFEPPLVLATTSIGAEVPLARRKGRILAGTATCPTADYQGSVGGAAAELDVSGNISLYMVLSGLVRKTSFDGLSFADAGLAGSPAEDVFLIPGSLGTRTSGTISLEPNDFSASPSQVPGTNIAAVAANDAVYVALGSAIRRCEYDSMRQFSSCTTFASFSAGLPRMMKTPTSVWTAFSAGAGESLPDGGGQEVGFTSLIDFTIDAPRLPSGTKACGQDFGRIYLLNASSIEAWLTDSQGLDSTAPWPHSAHDPANSRNLNRSTAPWSCP